MSCAVSPTSPSRSRHGGARTRRPSPQRGLTYPSVGPLSSPSGRWVLPALAGWSRVERPLGELRSVLPALAGAVPSPPASRPAPPTPPLSPRARGGGPSSKDSNSWCSVSGRDEAGVELQQEVTDGNAIDISFFDPEGNRTRSTCGSTRTSARVPQDAEPRPGPAGRPARRRSPARRRGHAYRRRGTAGAPSSARDLSRRWRPTRRRSSTLGCELCLAHQGDSPAQSRVPDAVRPSAMTWTG